MINEILYHDSSFSSSSFILHFIVVGQEYLTLISKSKVSFQIFNTNQQDIHKRHVKREYSNNPKRASASHPRLSVHERSSATVRNLSWLQRRGPGPFYLEEAGFELREDQEQHQGLQGACGVVHKTGGTLHHG